MGVVAISSSYLKIYKDSHDYSHNSRVWYKCKTTTEVLLTIPIDFTTLNTFDISLGIFKRDKKKALSLHTNSSRVGVDLLFDKANESEFSVFENALLVAQRLNRGKTNQLKRAIDEITLKVFARRITTTGVMLRRKSPKAADWNGLSEAGKC